jgi:hypothetical protein
VHLPQDYQLLSTVDHEVFDSPEGKRAGAIAQEYEHHGLASHVLLAGCKADETSMEFKQRGYFTTALLKVLRDPSVRLDAITYREVVDRLDDLPYVCFIYLYVRVLFIFISYAGTKRPNVKGDLTTGCSLTHWLETVVTVAIASSFLGMGQ